MRTARAVGWTLGIVGALAVLALAAVKLIVDPNVFKPRIESAVKQATGRDLELPGEIKLSVFPWLALEIGPASLGNPPGFPAGPFLSFDHASVRVRLLPLLAHRLEVARVDVDGLDLELSKNAAGEGNWRGFGGPSAAEPAPAHASPGAPFLGSIAGVALTHARVRYPGVVLDDVHLEAGAYANRGEVPVTLTLVASRGVPGEQVSVEARFDVRADWHAQRVSINAITLNTVINLAGHGRTDHAGATVPAVQVDLARGTATVPAFTLNADGAVATGSLSASNITSAPQIDGTLAVAPLVLREWTARAGLALPATRDPKAFSSLAASLHFAFGANALTLDPIQLTVDQTHVTGRAAVVNLDTNEIAFALAVDAIDLDRYRPPATQVQAVSSAETGSASSTPLEANGTLTVGAVHVSPLDLKNVSVSLVAHDQVMRLHPLVADVDGGRYSGDLTWDRRTPTPVLSVDENLSGIDVGRLLAADSKRVRLSGRGSLALKATGHGAGADALMRSLSGHFDLDVADGALEGVDLAYLLGRSQALLERRAVSTAADTGRTPFTALRVSAQIAAGVATTHDLLIDSPALRISGQGDLSLPAQTLDLALLAEPLRSVGQNSIRIPVTVKGPVSNPDVRPDVEALAKSQLGQRVKDVLQNKLEHLLGRP